eukprot:Nitzschia sp. Nitz4//scaffold12_size214221//139023//140117//NITZ4_001513-RA/size214221-processed-gene-0.168-mRNA-1//-1//CDS//3329535059//6202//frame0
MRATTKLLPSRSGNLGIFQLNNPKALHALTGDMIWCFEDVLKEWTGDSSLKAMLLKANNAEAKRPSFCAGGDVKAVWEEGMKGNIDEASKFFFDEYQVNHALATYEKPIISLWDGVVMGGGAGISVHGRYRVATENSLFAMPETAIGLFPDVGSMYWMPRLLDMPVAKFMAVSGNRFKAGDLVYSGLATHYVPSEKLEDLESALVEATETEGPADDAVAEVLDTFHVDIPTDECQLSQNKEIIASSFEGATAEEIFSALSASDDEFSTKTLATLKKMSPTSIKLSLEGLKRGGMTADVGEDLQMEYCMVRRCIAPGADFYEGVRSVLVDRDHAPKWNPPTIEEVTDARIEEFFAPVEVKLPLPN